MSQLRDPAAWLREFDRDTSFCQILDAGYIGGRSAEARAEWHDIMIVGFVLYNKISCGVPFECTRELFEIYKWSIIARGYFGGVSHRSTYCHALKLRGYDIVLGVVAPKCGAHISIETLEYMLFEYEERTMGIACINDTLLKPIHLFKNMLIPVHVVCACYMLHNGIKNTIRVAMMCWQRTACNNIPEELWRYIAQFINSPASVDQMVKYWEQWLRDPLSSCKSGINFMESDEYKKSQSDYRDRRYHVLPPSLFNPYHQDLPALWNIYHSLYISL